MPAWPTQSDYKDSLQNPDTAFREPDLKLSQAERSPMGVSDAPVLADYDGMCVPALDPPDPKKKLEQLEFGKPAYQHPARAVEKLSGALDHFSAWIILIALRAIAADPQLYIKYVLKTE